MPRASRRTPVLLGLLAVALAFGLARAQTPAPPTPILVMVSFDGWRWDYGNRWPSPNLQALAARGVRAGELVPAFPSVTFPNHYTLVTGLYPEHHGIVANNFADPVFPERFSMNAPTEVDARWWGGEPVWVTAIRQGRRSVSMFWPGSEAAIGGVRPTYWTKYDTRIPNDARVRQVLDWLALPEAERPSFVTVYFSEVDTAGHDYGPDSPEVATAVAHLDAALGDLVSGVDRLGLTGQTTFVVVSDHGMTPLSAEKVIYVDDYLNTAAVDVTDWSPVLGVWPRTVSVDRAYALLKGKHPALDVYRRKDIPRALHYNDNPRIPPVVGIAKEGWTITSHARQQARLKTGRRAELGGHGYDPAVRSMHALLVAAGPLLRTGLVVPEFRSVDVYDLLCAIANLKPAPNDGDAGLAKSLLK